MSDFEDRISGIRKAFGTGREMIYSALSDCYDLYVEIVQDEDLQAELKAEYAKKGLKDQKNTDDATRLARLALVEDSSKAHPYAKVLRVADEAGIEAGGLKAFMDERGGIESIRLDLQYKPADSDEGGRSAYEALLAQARGNLEKRKPITKFKDDLLRIGDGLGLLVVRQMVIGEGPIEVIDVINGSEKIFKTVASTYAKKSE